MQACERTVDEQPLIRRAAAEATRPFPYSPHNRNTNNGASVLVLTVYRKADFEVRGGNDRYVCDAVIDAFRASVRCEPGVDTERTLSRKEIL